jgi:hypothetical protein
MNDVYWFCSTTYFQYFTYGKAYKCVSDRGSYLLLENDIGEVSSPSKITKDGDVYKVNFMEPHDWKRHRSKKINQILDLPIYEGLGD